MLATLWRKDVLGGALLVVIAWAVHGHGLELGFWLDDHSHLELCRQNGFHDLANGNRFDWNGHIAHAWWAKKETGWAYFRPLTVALRTSLLNIFGLNPVPFHIVHLGMYSLTIVLFFAFLLYCGWSLGLAWFAVLFFVVHPANSLTTPWLASDCSLLVGLFLVSGLWFMRALGQSGHRRPVLLAGVFLCYVLAMFSRENGIMVGPILVLFDWLSRHRSVGDEAGPGPGRATWQRRWAIYSGLALLGLLFLPLRSWCLRPAPTPRNPYFHWPWEAGFASWFPFKILNDLVCLPLGLPLVPIAEVPWWQHHPVTAVCALLVVIAILLAIMVPLRRSRVLWGVLAGTILAQAPTLLVFSAPYNYYLATAGWAVLLALGARHYWRIRPRLVKVAGGVLAAWYLGGLWGGSWLLHSAALEERFVRRDVLATRPREYPQDTRLFFINMPFFAMEVAPSLRLAADRPDLEVFPLTLSPDLFFPDTEVDVIRENETTLLLRSRGMPLFAGIFGEGVQLSWFGAARGDIHSGPVTMPPEAGPMPFRVEVVEADSRGIRTLRFVFDFPLDDPHYRFFVATPEGLARELAFQDGGASAKPSPPFTPVEDRDFNRLKRMQRTYMHLNNILGNWPY